MTSYIKCPHCSFENKPYAFTCGKCDNCLGDEAAMHCHNKRNFDRCMSFIDDCEDHYWYCADGCHNDHGCQRG